MSHNILELQGIKNEEEARVEPVEEDVDCVDTKIWLWDGDQYEEFQSDYLNQIFPYKINKKTMTKDAQFVFHFLSSSLHYWIQLQQQGQSQSQKLGSKDIKVIDQIFQTDQSDNWIAFRRWGKNFNKREAFLKNEQLQQQFVHPSGELIHTYKRGEDEFQIVKYFGDNKEFKQFKERLQVLFLFYIDGVSFVFQSINTWIYYVIYKKLKGKSRKNVVGVCSKYVFRLSAIKERHRISQVFILPPYQKAGHGKELIDIIYKISLQDAKCFEITTQIPSFQYQCLRDFKQLQMLLNSNIINIQSLKTVVNKKEIQQNRGILLTKENVRDIKQKLKIPGNQIERLTNILIYYRILQQNQDMPKAHFQQDLRDKIIFNRSPFKTRRKLPQITFYGQVPNLKQFFLQKAKQDLLRNQEQVQQILNQTINGFSRVIIKLKKSKLVK